MLSRTSWDGNKWGFQSKILLLFAADCYFGRKRRWFGSIFEVESLDGVSRILQLDIAQVKGKHEQNQVHRPVVGGTWNQTTYSDDVWHWGCCTLLWNPCAECLAGAPDLQSRGWENWNIISKGCCCLSIWIRSWPGLWDRVWHGPAGLTALTGGQWSIVWIAPPKWECGDIFATFCYAGKPWLNRLTVSLKYFTPQPQRQQVAAASGFMGRKLTKEWGWSWKLWKSDEERR